MIYNNPLELIGNTPIVELHGLDTGPCRLFIKLEYQNPSASIKDRMALSMVEAAERDGKLKPGDTLIEATAGNTGLSLALVATLKGYSLLLVVPDKMSPEKIAHLRAMGTEVVLTRSDVERGHPAYYQDLAQKIADERDNAFYINQFSNPANSQAHEESTAKEIWQQMGYNIDAIICGVGSGGTLTGLGRFFKKKAPYLEMILADPEGSVLAPYLLSGKMIKPGSWQVEGIGEDFIPSICDLSLVSSALSISDHEAFTTARQLLRTNGIFAGSSTGVFVAAALKYCQQQTIEKRVLTFACDSGNKYLSKMYNDVWMKEQGFTQQQPLGDLRDLIAYPYDEHTTIIVEPEETLYNAYKRIKLNAVSQLPVIKDDKIIGIIDESDLLLALFSQQNKFDEPVSNIMSRTLDTIEYNAPITELITLFKHDHVAIVMQGDRFLGLISKIDLIQHLQQKST